LSLRLGFLIDLLGLLFRFDLSTDHFIANATGEPNDAGAIVEGEGIEKLWDGFRIRWINIGLGDGRSSVAREYMRMDIEPHLREVALHRAILSQVAIKAAIGRHYEYLGYQRSWKIQLK
jgi:hypothetical protein